METVRVAKNILSAFEIALDEGESWDDPLTINMDRSQANLLLACLTMQMQNLSEGVEAAKRGSDRGDLTSAFAVVALTESAQGLQEVLRIVAQVCDPKRYAEIMADHQIVRDEVGEGA